MLCCDVFIFVCECDCLTREGVKKIIKKDFRKRLFILTSLKPFLSLIWMISIMEIFLKFHIFFRHRHSPDQVLDNFLNKTHPMQWWPQQQNPRKNPHNKHIDERQKCYFLSKNNFFPDDFFNSHITLQIFNLGKKNNINAKDLLNWNILEQQHQSLEIFSVKIWV